MKSTWIPKDDREFPIENTGMRVWQCGCCSGVQGIDRDICHNCYEGKRPKMNPAMRKEHDLILKEWVMKFSKGHYA